MCVCVCVCVSAGGFLIKDTLSQQGFRVSLCVSVVWGSGLVAAHPHPPISLLLITLKAPTAFLQSEHPPSVCVCVSGARVKGGGLILSIKLSFQESIRWAQGCC